MHTCILFLALTCGGHFNRLAAVHLAAATFDGLTTPRGNGAYEKDPLVRPLIGTPPTLTRMALFGAIEVSGVELLPKKSRKWVRVGLTAAHLAGVAWNLKHR